MRHTLASVNRLDQRQRHEEFWQKRKIKFFLGIGALSFLLQLLFLGNMSYLYGSIWKMSDRFHNFQVLYVDYDGGIIGQAVNQTYHHLAGPTFPTFIQGQIGQYPTTENVIDAVKDTSYWAAFVVHSGASNNLSLALQGGDAARTYNSSGAMTYIWNEVRYPPFSDEVFQANLEMLAIGARQQYHLLNGSGALGTLNQEDPAAVQVLLNPIATTSVNIMSTAQGTKLFYNTVSMVMPILMQFFFLLILNGLSHEFQLYSRIPVHISGLVRLGLSIVYDLIAALCMSGYIWAFRETWPVSANQFVLTWMVLWLLMHIHFLIMDASTAFLPLPALPFFVLTWIIINITASISPFEVNPGFYRLGYALPTNEAYTVLTDIWSSGNVPQLYRALPVLFSWWIIGISVATYGHFYRCHKAWKQDQEVKGLKKQTTATAQDIDSPDSARATELDQSQRLLEATTMYSSAYSPSVPPPSLGLWEDILEPTREVSVTKESNDGRDAALGSTSTDIDESRQNV